MLTVVEIWALCNHTTVVLTYYLTVSLQLNDKNVNCGISDILKPYILAWHLFFWLKTLVWLLALCICSFLQRIIVPTYLVGILHTPSGAKFFVTIICYRTSVCKRMKFDCVLLMVLSCYPMIEGRCWICTKCSAPFWHQRIHQLWGRSIAMCSPHCEHSWY